MAVWSSFWDSTSHSEIGDALRHSVVISGDAAVQTGILRLYVFDLKSIKSLIIFQDLNGIIATEVQAILLPKKNKISVQLYKASF